MMKTVSAELDPVSRPRWRSLGTALLLAILMSGIGSRSAVGLQIAGLQSKSSADQLAEVLRNRVREFYSLLQMRQVVRAEAYTTEESRERLRDQASSPFLGFKIISTEVNPDGQSGTAVVEITVMAAFATSPIPIQRNSKWVIEDGEWRVVVPEPPEVDPEAMMGLEEREPPPPEELQFEGHSYGLGVMQPGEVKEARYPFKNVTDHAVSIKEIATDCECLVSKTKKLEYQPGEKGEIVIEFNSKGYEYAYMQTIVVTTSPGDRKSYLRIGAQVVPRAIAFPGEQAEAPQTSPQ
jgi:hypothetical protein